MANQIMAMLGNVLMANIVAVTGAVAEITGPSVEDARSQARIETIYQLSPYLRADQLEVVVLNGVATLTGSVPEAVNKELASAIAIGVEGVRQVDNQLLIRPLPDVDSARHYGEVLDDGTITKAIASKLAWSRHASGLDAAVRTREGMVTLSGYARDSECFNAATKLAATTRGVRSVDNRLVISATVNSASPEAVDERPGTAISDSWITTKVKYSLLYSSSVAGSLVHVSTERGVVTLKGRVSNGVERALAIELAQNVDGVKSVNADSLLR